VQNFTGRLTEAYGIQVRELSGDINLTKAEIAETQIIVTTPEKCVIAIRSVRTILHLCKNAMILLTSTGGMLLHAKVAREPTRRCVE
jgi:pre-mRNA-splicing helicase BRR2